MAYEALKSAGLEIIKNDSILSASLLPYNETYLLNIPTVEMRKEIHVNSIAFFNKRLFTLENVDSKVLIDFDALKLDTEFINNLSYIAAESNNFNLYTKDMLDKTKSVADKIVNELKRIEN